MQRVDIQPRRGQRRRWQRTIRHGWQGRGLGFEGDVEGRGQSETDKAMPPTKDDPPKEVLGSILAPAVQAGGN